MAGGQGLEPLPKVWIFLRRTHCYDCPLHVWWKDLDKLFDVYGLTDPKQLAVLCAQLKLNFVYFLLTISVKQHYLTLY